MKTSTQGATFLKILENAPLARSTAQNVAAYQDGGGVAIGYGCSFYDTAGAKRFGRTAVRLGDIVSRVYLEQQLYPFHVKIAEFDVNKAITAKLTQSQFDALVSICYNRGGGNFRRGGLVEAVNANPNNLAAIQPLMLAAFTNQNVGAALRQRREKEFQLYQSGTINEKPVSNIAENIWPVVGFTAAVAAAGYSIYRIFNQK